MINEFPFRVLCDVCGILPFRSSTIEGADEECDFHRISRKPIQHICSTVVESDRPDGPEPGFWFV